MSKRLKTYRLGLAAALVSVTLAALLILSVGGAVLAQGDPTPVPGENLVANDTNGDGVYGEMDGPRPAVDDGGATWTINERTFQSEFPDGFTFEIAVSSSAGQVTNARVVWQHSPGTNAQRSVGATYNEETGRWTAHWDASRNRRVPPWVLVRYRWQLTDDLGNRYVTEEIDETYADVEHADQWGHAESEDVVVYWIGLPDEVGQMTVDAMAAQRETFLQAWGGLLPYRPRAILYGWSERPLFEEIVGGPIETGGSIVVGTTGGDWGGTIQLAFGSTEETAYGTVLHEVAHLYQEEYARMIVDWFIEGNAEFFNLARDPQAYKDYARQRLLSGDPLSFAGGFSARGSSFQDTYWAATTIWDYLVETYGLDAHRQVWELIASNVPRFEALEQVTGVSVEQFEQDWRVWVGVNTPPPTLIPEPTAGFNIFGRPTPTFGAPGG